MTYFRELPNLEYQSFLPEDKSSDTYVVAKNIFRRMKIRDDLKSTFRVFDKYQIAQNSRPELVADEFYGSVQYDWVVLISAGITRVRDQWPLSDYELYKYAEEIYGEELNAIHHYETREVRDSQDRLILPAGKIVDSNFTIPNPQNPNYTPLNPVTGVTNYEYEIIKNDKKRGIYLLKPVYLQQVINDIRKEMIYDRSSQYVDEFLIRTENTKSSLP